VVPYVRSVLEWERDERSGTRAGKREKRGQLYFLPERFALNGRMTTELRHRGIYKRACTTPITASRRLPGAGPLRRRRRSASYRFEQPFLAVGISDVRGIENALKLEFDGKRLDFAPGSRTRLLGNGVNAPLPLSDRPRNNASTTPSTSACSAARGLDIAPVGRDSQVNLSADWPHPSFGGEFLPVERSVSDAGFSARWRTSFFASNMEEALKRCVGQKTATSSGPQLRRQLWSTRWTSTSRPTAR
jgi:inner membrane protein